MRSVLRPNDLSENVVEVSSEVDCDPWDPDCPQNFGAYSADAYEYPGYLEPLYTEHRTDQQLGDRWMENPNLPYFE